MELVSNRVEKHRVIQAPIARVWNAFATPAEFGQWFGANLTGEFVVGQESAGPMNLLAYEHLSMALTVARFEPPTCFAYRWHPYSIEWNIDYSVEKKTLVQFDLATCDQGTSLFLSETGFDAIPEFRRALAYRMCVGGWDALLDSLVKHVLAH